jgi:hypothetical protein
VIPEAMLTFIGAQIGPSAEALAILRVGFRPLPQTTPLRIPAASRRFTYDAAETWSRVRRIIARVEAGADGADTRFIVTNLGHGDGRSLYQDLYCRRG